MAQTYLEVVKLSRIVAIGAGVRPRRPRPASTGPIRAAIRAGGNSSEAGEEHR